MDGKPLDRNVIIRKALEHRHRVAFTIERVQPVTGEEDNRTVELSFASDTPVTQFLWSRWEYVDIELSMDKKAVRTERLRNGAAFLMDHDPGDQRGVIDSFTIAKPKSRAEVRFSKNSKGEELLTDIRDGIRSNISVGFIIHKLVLIEERKNEPDLYRAVDWEPYEISSVSIPADISVGVGRAMQMRAEGGDTCPDCNEPLAECTCDPIANETVSQASRQKRAISTNGDRTMSDKHDNAGNDPVVETRSAEQIETQRVEDIVAFATVFGKEDMARQMLAASKDIGLEDVREAIRAGIPPSTLIPSESAESAAARANGVEFSPAGEISIDKATRQLLASSGVNFDDKQIAATCTRSYKLAFLEYIRKGIGGIGNDARRALSEGVDSEGGFTVPIEFIAQMVEREPAVTSLQAEVTTLMVGSDKVTLPKNTYSASNLYTTGVRVAWVDEKTGPASESAATDFGNITIPIHTAMMYHDVTQNLIEDSAFDILGWLAGKFRETADVVTENVILNGTGIGQPEGILLNPNGTDQPATVVSGDANLLTADGLVSLAYSLLGRYRPNARFVFNSLSAELAIAKLKDTTNRYLFAYGMEDRNGLVSARPANLLGYPFISSDFMPNVAAGTFPVIFGDLKGYYLAKRIGFSIQVLNEIVKTANKVRVLGRMRIGGQVAEDWEIKIQKVSV